MKNETKQALEADNTADIVVIFIFGGFAVSLIMFGALSITTNIFNASFEWNKAIGWALLMAIFASFITMPIALIAGAIAASFGYKMLGKLPLWYLLILLPICAIALCVQNHVDGFFFSEITWRYIAEGLTPIFISYLLTHWWLNRKAGFGIASIGKQVI